jgi:hypothetical protein
MSVLQSTHSSDHHFSRPKFHSQKESIPFVDQFIAIVLYYDHAGIHLAALIQPQLAHSLADWSRCSVRYKDVMKEKREIDV